MQRAEDVVENMTTPAEIARQAEQFDDKQWYEFLDAIDEVSRRRRQRAPAPTSPTGQGRDEVAAWLAQQHFVVDSGIREVWYLPHLAPPEEIRFLEVNDRFGGNGAKAEAIDFGLDIEGARFRLLVADITSEQLDQIKQDPSRLPPEWSLHESTRWSRGA